MIIKSKARFVRTAPDKIRILAKMLKGKTPETALAILMAANKYAALPVIKVIKQAMAQIKDKGEDVQSFKIISMQVDEGPKLKRRRILHRGMSQIVLKRMAHVTISFDNGIEKVQTSKEEKPTKEKKAPSVKSGARSK